jgi:hypothetical protein
VVVAVLAVRVVQVAVDEIVRMVAMRQCFVAAVRSVNVIGGMSTALVFRGTTVLVRGRGCECVFVDMIAVDVVQVAIMEIVDVTVMADGRVSAVCTVHMRVPLLLHASISHWESFFCFGSHSS